MIIGALHITLSPEHDTQPTFLSEYETLMVTDKSHDRIDAIAKTTVYLNSKIP